MVTRHFNGKRLCNEFAIRAAQNRRFRAEYTRRGRRAVVPTSGQTQPDSGATLQIGAEFRRPSACPSGSTAQGWRDQRQGHYAGYRDLRAEVATSHRSRGHLDNLPARSQQTPDAEAHWGSAQNVRRTASPSMQQINATVGLHHHAAILRGSSDRLPLLGSREP